MTHKKPHTTSIRIRQSTYAWLQQKAADEGTKVIDLLEYIVDGYKNAPKAKPPQTAGSGGLPEYDVNGNRVARWIRDS